MSRGFRGPLAVKRWFKSGLIALSIIGLSGAWADAGAIEWRTSPAERTTVASAAAGPSVAEQLTNLASRSTARHIVVQFAEPLPDAQRAALAEAGVTLLNYLGDNAYFAALDGSRLDVAAATAAASISQADAIDPTVKLTPLLTRGDTPTWAVVNADSGEEPVIGTYVMFQRDVDLTSEAIPLIESYEGVVRDELESINTLVVELPQSRVYNLAEEDAVQWIEEALPRFVETNDSNRALTQANTVQESPYGLDGSGVTVLVYDGGTARASHVDFGGRLSVHDGSGTANHSTHVAGTIGGDGTGNSAYRGMAPNCTMLSYGFEYDGSGTFLYTNPGDIESDYTAAIALGADISNNSIGSNIEPNGFDCSFQGNYGVTSNLIDSIVCGSVSNGVPFRIVWANGNERQGDDCDIEGFGDYYSIAPPAGAKNHIAVGAVNSNDGSMTDFSSWGPTDDGRLRPDVSAPGCQSDGDHGVTSCSSYGDSSYATMCGTSMAAPTTTGLAALLLQDFRNQFPDRDDLLNSTIKILLAQTATDSGNAGPDYQYGYGTVRIQDAVDFMRTGNFDERELSQGQSMKYCVTVPAGAAQFKVTLAWDDYPGTPNVSPALVNDLDLMVYDPSETRCYPWTLRPLNPPAAAIRTVADHRNNIEQVCVDNPAEGQWRVVVSAYNVPEGPQAFSICSAYELAAHDCQSTGCPGDVNSDGSIDINDLAILLSNYGMTSDAAFEQGDQDADGDVDLTDLSVLLSVYGQSCS